MFFLLHLTLASTILECFEMPSDLKSLFDEHSATVMVKAMVSAAETQGKRVERRHTGPLTGWE